MLLAAGARVREASPPLRGDFEAALVGVSEEKDRLNLSPASTTAEGSGVVEQVTIGRQRTLWKTLDTFEGWRPHGAADKRGVKTAAIIAVRERRGGSILLTRRAEGLRTFPRAWVLPGGVVDEGETVREAARRELLEETGIVLPPESELKLVGGWESSFPTTSEACANAGGFLAHALMLCHVVDVPEPIVPPGLSPDEVDAAAWVPPATLAALLQGRPIGGNVELTVPQSSEDESTMSGVYPNARGQGIALGHHFVLQQLMLDELGGGVGVDTSPKL